MATASAKKNAAILYEWEGKDAKGNKQRGMVSSPSPDLVKAKLRRQGIIPSKVKKKRASGSGGKKIEAGDIAIFARQLTTMMGAGVPMVQSFEIVANGMDNPKMRDMVNGIKVDVEGGSNLTNALRKYPDQFDDLFCSLAPSTRRPGFTTAAVKRVAAPFPRTTAASRCPQPARSSRPKCLPGRRVLMSNGSTMFSNGPKCQKAAISLPSNNLPSSSTTSAASQAACARNNARAGNDMVQIGRKYQLRPSILFLWLALSSMDTPRIARDFYEFWRSGLQSSKLRPLTVICEQSILREQRHCGR